MTRPEKIATSTGAPGRLRIRAAVGLLAVTAIAAFGANPAPAAQTTGNHCIAPSGVDLNQLFGVPEQIVAPGSPSCTEVASGERWRPSVRPWFMNHTFNVVPQGFVAAGATPLEDFVAKFGGVRYVVDPGTKHQRTYAHSNTADLWVGTYNGFPLVNPLTLAALAPLPVGPHEVQTYWAFTAMHCNGFGANTTPARDCFPAGQTQLPTIAFNVTPGHY